jgi:N-acetyl-gamma-glutamyl-phosphate reductase
MLLDVFHNEQNGQALLSAVFNNLGKDSYDAAVQRLDLMLTRQ